MDFERAQNDVKRENEGDWQELVGFPGIRAFVLSSNSKVFQQTLARLRAAHRAELMRGGEAATAANERIQRHAVLSCVRDVVGFTRGGEPYPFSEFRDRLRSDEPEDVASLRDLHFALGIAVGSVASVDRLALDDLGKSPSEPSAPA